MGNVVGRKRERASEAFVIIPLFSALYLYYAIHCVTHCSRLCGRLRGERDGYRGSVKCYRMLEVKMKCEFQHICSTLRH